jgi:hypothetical protein
MELDQDIVLVLAQNESKISILYKEYSLCYPEMQSFWEEISGDENWHHDVLVQLADEEKKGQLYIDRHRFSPVAVQFVGNYLDEKIAQAKQDTKIGLTEALVIAQYIENSLLEKKFFVIFDSDSVEVKAALDSLEKDTEEHLKEVNQKINEYTHGPML